MDDLKQVEEGRGRCHRQGVVFHVVNEEFVGSRGGRKIPVEIVWKPNGSGLGALVFNICSCKVLYAHVRYHNGNGKLHTMPVQEWVSLTGKGHFRRLEGAEKVAFDEVLTECNKQKSFFGARMATIVTSILEAILKRTDGFTPAEMREVVKCYIVLGFTDSKLEIDRLKRQSKLAESLWFKVDWMNKKEEGKLTPAPAKVGLQRVNLSVDDVGDEDDEDDDW